MKTTVELFARKCDCCGAGMNEGYLIDNGSEYYCSDECLYANYSKEEWEEMYDDGEGNSYYTEWESDDMQFALIKGTLIELPY